MSSETKIRQPTGYSSGLGESMTDPTTIRGDMEAQLAALYREKEFLERELGVSSDGLLVAMVRSMEEQLVALYQEKEGTWSSESSPSGSSSDTL